MKKEIYTVLLQGKDLVAWFGGDGTQIPVWELDNKEGAEAFLEHNKYHNPKLIKATIVYKHSTDDCYVERDDGYSTCTFNHKAGEECLMDSRV